MFRPSGVVGLNVHSLVIESQVLKKNPLKDPWIRSHAFLAPADSSASEVLPLVVILAGFSSTGEKYLAPKAFEESLVQTLDRCFLKGAAPRARYLLVDAMTFWGGSQFLNSMATGRYEDHLMQEVLPRFGESCATDLGRVCVTGVSSGGYGALHLASRYPQIFPYCSAMAPDSWFEVSLKNDLLVTAGFLQKNSIKEVKKLHREGKIHTRKNGFTILNALAMSACYSPTAKGEFEFPLHLKTGEWIPHVLKMWRENDPVFFLQKRFSRLQKIKKIWLEVGRSDEYHLQFGARKIQSLLNHKSVSLDYEEFEGGHFDFSSRRELFWKKLNLEWNRLPRR
jgi:enterochelin esterase-like enzyme